MTKGSRELTVFKYWKLGLMHHMCYIQTGEEKLEE